MLKVKIENGKMSVKSDYCKEFVNVAKKLNGKWSGSTWDFDSRDEEKVRRALLDVYGSDGNENKIEKITVGIDLSKAFYNHINKIEEFGRILIGVNSYGNLKMHESVVITQGNVEKYSKNSSKITYEDDTIIEIKDVPIALFNKVKDEYEEDAMWKIELKESNNIDVLMKEKIELLNRLEEIEKLIEKEKLISN